MKSRAERDSSRVDLDLLTAETNSNDCCTRSTTRFNRHLTAADVAAAAAADDDDDDDDGDVELTCLLISVSP